LKGECSVTTLRQNLTARLPTMQQIWPVFSIVLFITNSWLLYRFFYQIPSWLYYLRFTNIIILLAYTLAFALIESIIVIGFVILICMFFPSRIFKAKFVTQGSVQVFIISLLTYVLRQSVEDLATMDEWSIAAICLAVILLLVVMAAIIFLIYKRFPVLEKWISLIADRLTIFGNLYATLGVLGMLIVVVRNIF